MRTPKLLVTLLVVGMAATGCSSTSSPQLLPAANTPAETEAPTPTPTPTPTPGVVAHIKDDQGYTFDVSYVYRQHVPTKDISAEAPGFNSIRIPLSASWTITNTTAGRDITFEELSGLVPTLTLVGLWPSTSDVCTYAAQPTSTTEKGGTCSIVLTSTQLPTTLSASQTVTPTAYAGYRDADAGVRQVPDAKYDAVLAELDSPASFSIRYNAADTVRFKDNCPDADLTSYLTQGMGGNVIYFNRGFLPIFSTTGSCSASAGVSQPPAQ